MRKFMIIVTALAVMAVPAVASAAPAKDTTVTTTTVGSCGSGPAGTINVANGVATIGVPDNMAYGVIKAFPTGLKVRDLKTLSFKSNSSAGGMVYMSVVTDAGHKVKYTPSAQAFPEPGIGSWYSHDVLSSGVRFNDADDNTPAQTWAQAVSQYGNESINRVSITAGCSLGHGTVQIDRMQVNNSVVAFKA
jgi:hypothetical protein